MTVGHFLMADLQPWESSSCIQLLEVEGVRMPKAYSSRKSLQKERPLNFYYFPHPVASLQVCMRI